MTKTWAAKDPDEVLDYTYDWSLDLETDETIIPEGSLPAGTAFVAVDAAGTAIVGAPTYGPDFVTVVISGGNEADEAIFTTRVKTTKDRLLEDTVILPIRTTVVPVAYPGGYVEPTAANLICLHPEFATVAEPTLNAYLKRAAASVDTSWSETDFGHARMLLAAHLLTTNGLGSTAQAQAISDGSGEFRSMAIGQLRLERFDNKAASGASSGFSTTRYGREFLTLLRRNKGGPRVAGYSSAGDRSAGDNFGPWTGP